MRKDTGIGYLFDSIKSSRSYNLLYSAVKMRMIYLAFSNVKGYGNSKSPRGKIRDLKWQMRGNSGIHFHQSGEFFLQKEPLLTL